MKVKLEKLKDLSTGVIVHTYEDGVYEMEFFDKDNNAIGLYTVFISKRGGKHKISRIKNNQIIRQSSTVSGQREAIREIKNKLNGLIEEFNKQIPQINDEIENLWIAHEKHLDGHTKIKED